MYHQIENTNKEIESIKENQVEILELESIITDIKKIAKEVQYQTGSGRRKNQWNKSRSIWIIQLEQGTENWIIKMIRAWEKPTYT